MNGRDKSCACIDFNSSIGGLTTLSSAIKWRGKLKFKSNLNHPNTAARITKSRTADGSIWTSREFRK